MLGGMPEPDPRRALIWEALEQAMDRSGQVLEVVDAGGGTGGFAVPLAELGHRVTVVDLSPDSLAALARRAAERGCSDRVRGVQGDLTGLPDLVATGSVDVVLCHSVLESVDDPAAALRAAHAVLRPGGLLSVVVATRTGAVLTRVLAGRFTDALALLGPAGGDPAATSAGAPGAIQRRFDAAGLGALVAAAGFGVQAVHNIRVFTDLVGGAVLDADPAAAALLADLERRVGADPQFAALAVQLHLVGRR